jgi:hypothetical protein
MTIYAPIDSPCRVLSKYDVFKFFFELISGQKNHKNGVKIRVLIGLIKKSCLYHLQNEPLAATFEWVLAVL